MEIVYCLCDDTRLCFSAVVKIHLGVPRGRAEWILRGRRSRSQLERESYKVNHMCLGVSEEKIQAGHQVQREDSDHFDKFLFVNFGCYVPQQIAEILPTSQPSLS